MKKKLENIPLENMHNSFIISGLTTDVVNKYPVDRGLVFTAQNGGPDKYGSILFEYHSDEMKSIKEGFFKKKLDPHYCLLLKELKEKQTLLVSTESLPLGSYLRRRYESDKVKASLLILVADVENKGIWHSIIKLFSKRYLYKTMYYLSFNCITNEIFSDDIILEIEAKANEIKNIFQNSTL